MKKCEIIVSGLHALKLRQRLMWTFSNVSLNLGFPTQKITVWFLEGLACSQYFLCSEQRSSWPRTCLWKSAALTTRSLTQKSQASHGSNLPVNRWNLWTWSLWTSSSARCLPLTELYRQLFSSPMFLIPGTRHLFIPTTQAPRMSAYSHHIAQIHHQSAQCPLQQTRHGS